MSALMEIVDKIVRDGAVEIPDPLEEGASYRLMLDPRLQWRERTDRNFGSMCVRFPVREFRRSEARDATLVNFGTIISAICSGVPVRELQDGQWLPDDYPTEVSEPRHDPVEFAVDQEPEVIGYDGGMMIRLDTNADVVMVFPDGQRIAGRIRSIEWSSR